MNIYGEIVKTRIVNIIVKELERQAEIENSTGFALCAHYEDEGVTDLDGTFKIGLVVDAIMNCFPFLAEVQELPEEELRKFLPSDHVIYILEKRKQRVEG